MKDFQTILAVMQEDMEAPCLLCKLHRLNANQTCDISVIRVVYEGLADLKSRHVDVSKQLRELVLRASQTTLSVSIEETSIEVPGLTSAAMWDARTSEGITKAARSIGADLIIKTSAHATDVSRPLRTPDDWNLLRHANVPVLLTQSTTWPAKPIIVAAIDVYDPSHEDLNARILASAQQLTHQLNGELHLACIFPGLSNWLDEITSMQSYAKLRRAIEEEIFEELAAFTKQEKISDYKPHAIEGVAAGAMRNLVGLLGADLVVLGTKARTGVTGMLLGNTAEKLLNEVTCDILTVP